MDKIEAVVGVASSAPAGVLFTVASWADFREMNKQVAGGGWPSTFSFRGIPAPDADAATREAWDAANRRRELADLAAAPPLPLNASPLTRYVREATAAAVRAGAPKPNADPFAASAGGWHGRTLDPAAHVGAVEVTEEFAAEWDREWAAVEAGEPTPNLDASGRLSMYHRA